MRYLFAILILATANVGYAAEKKLKVCVNSSGAISAKSKCSKGEAALTLSRLASVQSAATPQVGPQGPQGPRGASAFDILPSGTLIQGIVGADYHSHSQAENWTAYASLNAIAPADITDSDVIIAATPALTSACPVLSTCLDSEEQLAAVLCQGSATNPNPPPGKVCVYPVSLGGNVFIKGIAFPYGGAGRRGFGVFWHTPGSGDTYFEGVWAYRAP